MLSHSLTVRGFLADAHTGAGLGDLKVELWAANGGGPSRMAVSRSDDTGLFRLRVGADKLASHPTRSLDVELRVLDGARLVLSELRELPLDDPPDLSLIVPPSTPEDDVDAAEPEATADYVVFGRIKGTVPDGATVQAVLKTLRDRGLTEQVVADAAVDASGSYRMRFERPADGTAASDASLSIRLLSSDGLLLAESAPVLAPGPSTRINLRPRQVAGVQSEYDLLQRRIADGLTSGVTALDGVEESAVEEVSNWIDVDADRLLMLQQARALGDQTSLPAAIFYALGRSGTGVSLDDLVDVPIDELRTTIQEAAAAGIIDSSLLADSDAIVERLAREVVDDAIRPGREAPVPRLAEILGAADIPREAIEHTLRRYQQRGDSAADFWSSFGEADGAAEAIGDDTSRDIRTAVQLSGLVGPDPALLRRMHELRREGRWRRPEDLTSFTFDDWCELIEAVEPALESELNPESEEERAAEVEERAEQILDTLEETFPSEFIRNRLSASDDVGAGARMLISRAPEHDFLCDSIRSRCDAEPGLLEGLDEGEAWAAMEEVEAVERIARVTKNADELGVLVGTGMRSALDIGSMPSRQFIDIYAEALGGRAQAARVYGEAQQTAAATKLTTVRLLQSLQHMPLVIGGAPPDIKDVPELRTLFKAAGGFCDCEHCGSVYSPAAYFVDLLRYLNVSTPRVEKMKKQLQARGAGPAAQHALNRYQFQPLDVLLNRRPDLADLPLTCENTLTPLPYIDLVNELLEAFITGESAAHDTGKTPADVLKAVPQHISKDAYRRLQEAVHPLALPYHQPLSLARAYLGHLGVTRAELVRTLGRGETRNEALSAESVAMSPEEFGMIARPPADLWRHFGFAAAEIGNPPASYVKALERVPAFLEATGITFQTLIDLVSTRFLNADNQLQLETPSPDCDPEIIRIAGLDEPRLSRMLRMIRLQRRLGWPFVMLDRALVAFGAKDLDVAVLEKLAAAQDVVTRLDRPLAELLVLWAPLDAWGKDSQFDKLFTTRAVAWQTQDERTFQLRPDRAELGETSEQLDGVASALLAAFRITSEELALIRALQTRRSAAPRLDIAGLSAIYRVVVLARALQLRISALDLLLRMTPPEANPFQPGDPAATRRFIDIVHEVQASDFTPERLAYLFRHEWEPRRDPGPLPAQVEAVLGSIRRGLADAFSETTRPAEVTGDTLRQKLGSWLDPALLDPAIEALDPRSPLTTARRREFFNRYLARIFPDPAAAAARLFGATTEPVQAGPQPSPAPPPAAPLAVQAPPAVAAPAAAPEPPAATPTPVAPAATESAAAATATLPAAPMSPAGQAGSAAEAVEALWKAHILFVLDHLLPLLRTRQLRGAVVQTLSDTLGLTAPATARLLDVVMRSRQLSGQPLLADFLALLGRGLTGAYYANADLSGEPAVVRIDPELTFAWAGAPPADGVPGRQFSARWTGRLLARSKAPHTFYLQTDGAARLTLKIAGNDRVLIDQPAGAGRAVELASEPVDLDPAQLTEIRVEYRNQGGPATFVLQFGTGPAAKQVVPRTNLYPVDGLSSFAPVEDSYRRLHKAALVLTGFGITDAQLEWLTADPPYVNLDALPTAPPAEAESIALFRRWYQLARLYALRRRLPRANVDLFDVFRAATMAEALERLVLATGWERGMLDAFVAPDALAIGTVEALRPSVDAVEEPIILRLARAMDVQRRVGVAPATLYLWANTVPDADAAASIVQAVKARYDETRWLEVARTLNDPLRAERRDALVAYLLPRMRELGVKNRNQLFEYFLIDVEMNPCMLTSRIRQATGAVQTFFQRCLMNLEAKVPARVISDKDWQWLKTYRVWEANRKVFLYPENWIEPELRDDKSPLFQTLESTILQQEIKKENVEAAFADYLEGLDEISRLDVRGVWFEQRERHRMVSRPVPKELRFLEAATQESKWDIGTYHVFARTFNAPYVWYYRRLENGRNWTAWEKIEVDIESDHLVPVVFQRRMHLFWTQFQEVSKPLPPMNKEKEGPPPPLAKDWEIHLAYSVYDRGRWSRKRMSTAGVIDDQTFVIHQEDRKEDGSRAYRTQVDGSRVLEPGDYTLRATIAEGDTSRLRLRVYCRAVERSSRAALSLTRSEVLKVATFELKGCNGSLVPNRRRSRSRGRIIHTRHGGGLFKKVESRASGTAQAQSSSHPFRLSDGGALNAPAGYSVDGMTFAAARDAMRPDQRRHHGTPTNSLAFPLGDARGTAVALPAKGSRADVQIVPVIDPRNPAERGLYPFFYQDSFRSYFVRPVDLGWRMPLRIAMPLFRRAFVQPRRPAPRPSPGRPPAPRRRGRGGRGGREDIEEIDAIWTSTPEALDAWEDEQDEAWHPDDAAEARQGRQRQQPPPTRRTGGPRPAPAPRRPPAPVRAPIRGVRRVAPRVLRSYREQKLRFTPFEHLDTCRLISTLKDRGIDGLLEFKTTRPPAGKDHILAANGIWTLRAPTWFERHYGVGPLIDRGRLPHTDIAFENDNAYSLYNWELFFHAPLQVAIRLAKDGRHEEAQRWFHFIFDPTTDSSAPSPRRYWQFAPFYDNNEYASSRELLQLLSYGGENQTIVDRQYEVREQLSAWWEKPFSPHVIARLRIAAYQKAVVMKYIDNLIEWGDKLFRRDSMESIQEATQIYILAANILGPRPEKIPPIVSKEPLTFQKMRHGLDLFSNFEVRLENLQVRRPFRVSARPDQSAASSVLGMATQYFCTPPNPQLDKYWDTVADRLFKIRNCMNIEGIVRQLALFEPPIDPGLLVRAAAAGVDLGSVIASLNAPPPHYRFRFLLARAVRLAEEIRTFGAMTLQVLERRDAEALAALRASNEVALLNAVRDVRKKQVRQVEEALAELSVQREHIDIQIQHLNAQLQQLMSPQEAEKQKSLSAAQVLSGVQQGIELVSKVMHAIPEFQTGAAGGFSSPFVTLQLGGQMFGDIAEAFASSVQSVMSQNETAADLAEAQAEYQRRKEEWEHELELLKKEKAKVEKKIAETNLKLDIASAELRCHDLDVENSRKVQTFFRDKYTNEQLYGWMMGQLSSVYFQAYKVAFDAAQQAERAFRFERGDSSSSFVEFSYWDSLKKGLLAGERLLLDLRRMESAHVEGDRRSLEVTRHISLREDFPLAWLELVATGRCQIEVTEALLDGDFPGHFFRRIKTVSLTVSGVRTPHRNVNCTVTLLENRIRTNANASGAYAQSADGEDSRFSVNPVPIQAIATSKPDADAGVFHLRFDDDRYLPFEGAGAISTWRIELPQADNALALDDVSDVVLSLLYTARTGGGALEAVARADREKGLGRGGIKPEPQHLVSLKRDFPAVWKQLGDAAAGQEVEASLPLPRELFSGRFRGLDLRVERVTMFAYARGELGADALKVRLDPPKGSGTAASGWVPPWPRSRVIRATAEVSGPAGTWKLAVTPTGRKLAELVDDLVLVFDVRARRK